MNLRILQQNMEREGMAGRMEGRDYNSDCEGKKEKGGRLHGVTLLLTA